MKNKYKTLRRWILALFFGLYILTFIFSKQGGIYPQVSNWILYINPLIAINSFLNTGLFLPIFISIALPVVLTFILGRVWCGWICPLGFLLDIFKFNKKTKFNGNLEKYRTAKYILLILLLMMMVFGSSTLMVFEPITILNRVMSGFFFPAVQYGISAVESFLYQFESLWGVLDQIHPTLDQFFRLGDIFIPLSIWIPAGLFLLILAANGIKQRFWCRYLCPLGAFYGLIAKLSLTKRVVTDGCISCANCETCPMGTINPENNYQSDPGECIVCLECKPVCPKDVIQFPISIKNIKNTSWQSYDPGRRTILTGAGLAVGGLVINAVEGTKYDRQRMPLRPPAVDENEFLSVCVRCGQCIQVCPTSGLQFSTLENGLEQLMTPMLVPRLGYCDINCVACSQICPVEAIPGIRVDDKPKYPIGLARIDKSRCFPWAYETICLICEEACPLPEKAIKLKEVQFINDDGEPETIKQPHVIRDRCIGCGICEHQCPAAGDAAIQVHPVDVQLNLFR